MFIGHFALGYAAKRSVQRTSLVTLFVAAQLADILWPILLALGIETVKIVPNAKPIPLEFVSYPYSHSLLTLAIMGALFGVLYFAITKRARSAWIIFALVVSHWVLDWITHIPDMPLWPGGPKFGLGLWNYQTLSMVIELAMFLVGVRLYAGARRPRDRQGRIGFWTLFALFIVSFFANEFSGAPPSVQAIWITGILGTAVTLALAWWTDSHRGPAHDPRRAERATGRG